MMASVLSEHIGLHLKDYNGRIYFCPTTYMIFLLQVFFASFTSLFYIALQVYFKHLKNSSFLVEFHCF